MQCTIGAFWRADITAINVFFNLVLTPELKSGPIATLVNVLEWVLDGSD
jgi:hypothetical protein